MFEFMITKDNKTTIDKLTLSNDASTETVMLAGVCLAIQHEAKVTITKNGNFFKQVNWKPRNREIHDN
jgi:hypothetical protein